MIEKSDNELIEKLRKSITVNQNYIYGEEIIANYRLLAQ